ncbi:MAG TPA: pitrilysin family protein, partial [Longimicrobiales bacterium]|nr:pitrilysin family protein [Longimicrobiales bacterium]
RVNTPEATTASTGPDRTRAPEPAPVRPFDFPPVHRERLAGDDSPELLVAHRGDLPLVTVELVVEAGASAERAPQAGIARLTANALEAGTTTRDEEALAWELESLGIQLNTAAGWDAASVEMTVHVDRLDQALGLLAEIVRRPAFPEDVVARMRDEQRADILQRKKEPRALASDAAAWFIFADDVPYGRSLLGSDASVEGLDADALRAFHQERYRGGSAALLMAGDVQPDRARDLARRHFGDWKGSASDTDSFDVTPRVDRTTVFIVHRPGSVQSEIRMGHVGVERTHRDYFPLAVMNHILGGAFTSRLNMSLRERHGFTYGARSAFALRRRPGPFSIDVAVASDVTARAIQEALKEIHGLREDGPTEQEMDSARDYLRGVLPLRLETTSQLASRVSELVVYDLPDDYFDHYRDRIAAVPADEVRRVAREAVRPESMAIVVVGDADQIRGDLEALDLGPIQVHTSLP